MSDRKMTRGEFMRDPAAALDLATLYPVHIVGEDGTVLMTLSQPTPEDPDDVPIADWIAGRGRHILRKRQP